MQLDEERVDEACEVLYLHVPQRDVALFQALVESYEGLAAVRTLNVTDSIVALFVTPDTKDSSQELLRSLSGIIAWQPRGRPPEAQEISSGNFSYRGSIC